jgi:hypothetical protein
MKLLIMQTYPASRRLDNIETDVVKSKGLGL